MNNYVTVRPEHLNSHGYLFGGEMLRWVDEFAYLAASLDFPECRLVTIAMDQAVFRHPAHLGDILRFHIVSERRGTTSVTYRVDVFATRSGREGEEAIFSTRVTFVSVSGDGRKQPLPPKDHLRSADWPQ